MTDDDRAGLAAEYVLGTLDADERDEADALIARDPAFAAQVAAWERRLGELDTMVDPVTPPAAIWMALRARLPEPSAAAPPVSEAVVPESVAPEPPVAPVAPEIPVAAAAPTPPVSSSPPPFEPIAAELIAPAVAGADKTPAPAASSPDVLRAVAEALAMPLAETEARVTPPASAPPRTPAATTAPAGPAPITAGDRDTTAVDIKIFPDEDATVPGYPRGPAGVPDIGPAPGPSGGAPGGALIPLPTGGDDATVRRLVRSVQRWRSLAVGLSAFVLALGGLAAAALFAPDRLPPELRLLPGRVEIREVVRTVEVPIAPSPAPPAAPPTDPARHVAVLQAEGTTPAFIVSLQPDRKSLMVRRVKAADEGDKRYELWLVSDKYPAPRSLGLLGTAEFTIVPAVADFPPDVVAAAVYAVSLEAETGSPIDGPSTPVVASGRLIEAVPEMPAAPPSGSSAP
ncbi:anti-sigma factor domain-containing protein [Rhodoplanes azumiensis]|uniref:Anti-sigma factor domain-containing protein n=1 Tax=Rhodoplanes azumiensis TaxID=1897628 RepID=A0ABW5AIE7_9BRAD